MAENLKATHYRNGEPIPNVADPDIWAGLATGAYCNYYNNEDYVAIYGRLYNWYAVVDSQNIAPIGWHLPTDEEWKQLELCLGMSQDEVDSTGRRGTDEGGKLKEAGTEHWRNPNTGATNESGFTALPGGFRSRDGDYYSIWYKAIFWSSTEYSYFTAWGRQLEHNFSTVVRSGYDLEHGFSIRCVRD